MCTLCPCVVSLENDENAVVPKVIIATDAAYENNRRACGLADVGKHIKELTDTLSPDGRIVATPIYIRVMMKDCPTLTLTDLPGGALRMISLL